VPIPNAGRAIVPSSKLRDYLLSESHPVGRFKARFFLTLGFRPDSAEVLEGALRALLESDAERETPTPYGIKYEVRGNLVGPNGQSARVVSVWIIRSGEEYPRFVTAYPG
jgi:hypothetical protein